MDLTFRALRQRANALQKTIIERNKLISYHRIINSKHQIFFTFGKYLNENLLFSEIDKKITVCSCNFIQKHTVFILH